MDIAGATTESRFVSEADIEKEKERVAEINAKRHEWGGGDMPELEKKQAEVSGASLFQQLKEREADERRKWEEQENTFELTGLNEEEASFLAQQADLASRKERMQKQLIRDELANFKAQVIERNTVAVKEAPNLYVENKKSTDLFLASNESPEVLAKTVKVDVVKKRKKKKTVNKLMGLLGD
eukprot:TRINITY_DN26984_c0_g1_i1.p1 TRINITY_DN26984_c0_g1~~TRINITY_DN26984_c0_g1_i1.p1  ORF type:complete len:182 (-),score=68.51 TRINITY_DN26984_c0_g1_i1:167-712(-)